MRRCIRGHCRLVLGALLAVGGCSTRTLGGDGSTGGGNTDDGNDDGGWGGDDGDDGADGDDDHKYDVMDPGDGDDWPPPDPDNPYPNCFEEECPGPGGWGMIGPCGETCMCSIPCNSDADCPRPLTGDAKPVCEYECMLVCDPQTICPDGMYCYPEGGQCMWGTYDPEECDPDGPGAYCEQYCEMENLCLDMCGCDDGWCPCNSEQRYEECRRDCPTWLFEGDVPPDPECTYAASMWMECIVWLTCGEAVEFFMNYPDGHSPDAPCMPELGEARAYCPNFELLTEYGF
jgi:hypothetical protein